MLITSAETYHLFAFTSLHNVRTFGGFLARENRVKWKIFISQWLGNASALKFCCTLKFEDGDAILRLENRRRFQVLGTNENSRKEKKFALTSSGLHPSLCPSRALGFLKIVFVRTSSSTAPFTNPASFLLFGLRILHCFQSMTNKAETIPWECSMSPTSEVPSFENDLSSLSQIDIFRHLAGCNCSVLKNSWIETTTKSSTV